MSRQVSRQLRQIAMDASDAINMEARYKAQLIGSNAPDMSPLMNALSDEAQSFQRDFQVVARAYNQMYYRNEFFLRSMDETATQVAQSIVRAARSTMYAVAQATSEARAVLAEKWEQFVFQVNFLICM